MKTLTDKFDYKVPQTSPVESERGKKVEGVEYTYRECESDVDVEVVLKEKEWTLLGLVNDKLKASARANAYQNALAPHKPTTMTPEKIVERMIGDFQRMGFSENVAREMVTQALASK